MSVGVLLITHGNLGAELISTAEGILGLCPLQTEYLSVPSDTDPESIKARASQLCHQLDEGDGVLVLTDIYGSTPSNIANDLMQKGNIAVISGVNQPMLIRVMNYPALDLQEMIHHNTKCALYAIHTYIERQFRALDRIPIEATPRRHENYVSKNRHYSSLVEQIWSGSS